MNRYAVGVDFGSLSGRAVVLDLSTGEVKAGALYEYPHGVMDSCLPDGTPLGDGWALQHPQDYLDVLSRTVPQVLQEAGVSAQEIAAVGIDCTASTALPVRTSGKPLCFEEKFASHPHAYAKMWKHHAAQPLADEMTRLARERGESWLAYYGGRVSSEWSLPKLWQMLREDEEVSRAADRWVEAADWIVWQLCGKFTPNACAAGYKAFWRKGKGYPSRDFFAALDERLALAVEEKLGGDPLPPGSLAGFVTKHGAALTGLAVGTPVAVGGIDAHICAPAAGIDGPGQLLAIIGTSSCHILMSEKELTIPGICGMVEDGILPGLFGYEAGQSAVGDCFAWYLDNCLPASVREEAAREGKGLHAYLRERASRLRPGESGLLALDWWNGNRSVLTDVSLSGTILGLTLRTKPEEIYRALLEATAYGTRMIVENYRAHGLPVERFVASGGIPLKDPLMMQIYADVLGMPVHIAAAAQGPAVGSAILAAVAAGRERSGFGEVGEAVRALGKLSGDVYVPNPEAAAVYDRLFAEYREVHDFFGRGGSGVMHRLRAIRAEA